VFRYSVPDMTCGHCASVIEKAVKGLDPQAEVAVDLTRKEVTVQSTAKESQVGDNTKSR
jgi:copper chaperone